MIRYVAALVLLGQLPEPIRVTTRLVEVNVVVRDKKGPVAGLTADDFILRDRGRPQKIAMFRENSSRVVQAPSPSLEPGEFTNRHAGKRENSQHAVVIVWDHLNSSFGDAAVARRKALHALGQIQINDRVCLYTLDSELRVIQDFTSDSSLLVSALRSYREEKQGSPVDVPLIARSPAGDPAFAEMIEAINAAMTSKAVAYRSAVTAAAIRAIANHLANVPGRKSVIWIASEIPGATAGLAGAGISLYPVDIGGTSPSSPQFTQMERSIAQNSGGVAYIHSDLRGAIDRAMKDSEAGYSLGFYPEQTPARMNALKIEIKRRRLEVGYRNSYSGIEKPNGTRDAEIGLALASPLDATGVGLDVRMARQDAGWTITLELDPADIALENRNARRTGGLEIALRQLSRQGSALATNLSSASFDLDEPHYQVFMKSKRVLNFTIPDPMSGLAEIRLVVKDRVSGRIGSITMPLP